MMRRLLKHSKWPPPYWITVTVWDIKSQQEKKIILPISLPHEIIGALAKRSSKERLLDQSNLTNLTKENLKKTACELGWQTKDILACGLWGDGVPVNWDRSQSCDFFCLAFPGLGDKHCNLRVPLAAINHKYVVKQKTYDDILEAVAWSFKCLAVGQMPAVRHDNKPWLATDVWRKKQSGKSLPLQAALVEVRGDWKFFKDCFRFPQFNEVRGCCWLCAVKPAEIRDCGSTSAWRAHRLTHWQVLARLAEQGKSISTLFATPGLRTAMFLIDWLHCCDQGVAANCLGSLSAFLVKQIMPASVEDNCKSLFLQVQSFYKRNKVTSQLDNITPTMIQKSANATPKLRGKAGEIRALVPFAFELEPSCWIPGITCMKLSSKLPSN